jgi:hypothetical protein
MTAPETAARALSPSILKALVKRLRRAAWLLKTGALLTLFAIIAIIAGGTWLFVEAGAIAASDTDMTTRLVDISMKQIEKLTGGLLRQDRDEAVDRLIKAGVSGPESTKILDDLRAITETHKKIASDIGERMERTLATAASPSDVKVWQTTISTSIARLSAVGLLLFLVQIFMTLYRYNYRLGAYYSARADALELLADGSLEELQRLTTILSPDALDFGELPKSPTEHVMQFARDAIGSARNVIKP